MSVVRSPYGRHVESRPSGALVPYQGTTYYDLPAVKASPYGWLIVSYFFVGGVAGAGQVLAAVADLAGRDRNRHVVRAGRYLALAGSLVSPVFLIADLRTPQRWYNMMRIFRPTSAMSIGSWTLAAFGAFSGLTALGQFWEDRTGSRWGRWLARMAGLPAGAAGAVMSVYTGTLLAATATPLWASVPRLLPVLFGTSAVSTATAALGLTLEATGAPEEEKARVERFAVVAGAAELAAATATRASWREQQQDGALRQNASLAGLYLGAVGLGVVVPLAVHGVQALTGRRSRGASLLASASALVGGFLLRAAVLQAGNESARRPRDYFRLTQPAAPALSAGGAP